MSEFDPNNSKYQSVEDLPTDEQSNFVNVEDDGFAQKEAVDNAKLAEMKALVNKRYNNPRIEKKNAEIAEHNSNQGSRSGRYKSMLRPKEPILSETAMDVLHSEALEMNSMRARILNEASRSSVVGKEYETKALEDFNDDSEVMLAIDANLEEVSDRLKNSKYFITEKIKKYPRLLEDVEKFQNDKDVVMEAVAGDPETLRFASAELQDDLDVVMTALQNEDEDTLQRFPHMSCLQHASDRIKQALGYKD